ncbi:EamA family transporter [Phaeacidiphilus oryzae]|uniref:EamA family transporter n=1 Tax=Phaeacidiphilus oryzae TaxID=348818 RepID=UPI0009FDEA27
MRTSAPGRSAGIAVALVSAVAFGGSGVAAKPLLDAGVPPFDMVWLRVAGAALVLLPVAARHAWVVRRRPRVLVGFGLLGIAGVQTCYFSAISDIPVGVALLLEYLAPPLILGWVRFVQRKPVTRAAALGAVVAVAGLACVVEVWAGLGGLRPVGVLLGLGAACCQVGYFLFSEAASDPGADGRTVPPLALTAWGMIFGAVVMTALARPWGLHWAVLGRTVPMGGLHAPAWLLLAWVVLIATVLAYLTGIAAIGMLSPAVAGVVACLEAVVAAVGSWIMLDQRLALPQVVGGLLVLTGALIAQSGPNSGTRQGDWANAEAVDRFGSGIPDSIDSAPAPRHHR